jgi:hypothetical protein
MIVYKRDYLIFGFVVIMLVLYGVRLKIGNDISTLGIKVQETLDKTKLISTENDRIRAEILEAQSLTVIASRAAELGYQKAHYVYVYVY